MKTRDSGEKTFAKYFLKKDPNTGEVIVKNDKPVYDGEKVRDTRMEQRHANILNKDWKQSGVIWAEEKTKSPADDERAALLEEVAKLKAEGKIAKMPNPLIGIEKLKELIKNAKSN